MTIRLSATQARVLRDLAAGGALVWHAAPPGYCCHNAGRVYPVPDAVVTLLDRAGWIDGSPARLTPAGVQAAQQAQEAAP